MFIGVICGFILCFLELLHSYLSGKDSSGIEGFGPIFSPAEAVDSLKFIALLF